MPDIDQIAKAAKSFACTLYKNQPGSLVPNPISDVLYQAWDGFCGGDFPDPAGLPAPPAPPFQGGQCVCVVYDIAYTAFEGSASQDGYIQRNLGARVLGKIGSPFSEQSSATNWQMGFYCQGNLSTGCQPFPYRLQVGNARPTRDGLIPYYRINSITRVGGGVDNCGNPPGSFPTAPPPPPNGYTSPPTPITFNDNSVKNYYFNFKPPAAPSLPANFIPPIIINYLNPSLNPEFNIPISFNFDGSIKFGGGGGTEFNQGDRDTINNINNTTNNLGDSITNIENEINNVTNYNNNKPESPDDFEPPVTDQPPGEYEQTFLGAVTIALTTIPVNAKKQSGNSAPDVIYAGWFEWKKDGWAAPRQNIHFEDSIFLAPKGVNGFAYTLYEGFDGRATSIIYKEKI